MWCNVNGAGVTVVVFCYICFAQVVMKHAYAVLVDVNVTGADSTRCGDSHTFPRSHNRIKKPQV
jgi:hypothetical protein